MCDFSLLSLHDRKLFGESLAKARNQRKVIERSLSGHQMVGGFYSKLRKPVVKKYFFRNCVVETFFGTLVEF